MNHSNIIISTFNFAFAILFSSCNKDTSLPIDENINTSSNADNSNFKYNAFAKEFAEEIVSELNKNKQKFY